MGRGSAVGGGAGCGIRFNVIDMGSVWAIQTFPRPWSLNW